MNRYQILEKIKKELDFSLSIKKIDKTLQTFIDILAEPLTKGESISVDDNFKISSEYIELHDKCYEIEESEEPVLTEKADSLDVSAPIPQTLDTKINAPIPITKNKKYLIDQISKNAGLTKEDSKKALDAFISSTTDALNKGDRVALVGFGSFSVSERSARTGRNPQTGKEISIAAKKVIKFKAGGLK